MSISILINLITQGGPGAQSALQGVANAAKTLGAATALAGAGMVALSNKAAEAGRNVEENQNLIKESFGSSLSEIQKWGDGLNKTLGLSSGAAQRNAATFNVMFNSMGIGSGKALEMSKSLTMLAEDMASFYNLDPTAAFDKLRAGITGEAEPLKALGILINEETINQYAYANGIAAVGEKLTEQQKVMARFGAIMQQTTKAQGDLSRTMDSGANTARRMGNMLDEATNNFGKGAAEAQKQVDTLFMSLLTIVNSSPEVQAAAGRAFTWTAWTMSAVGGVVAVGAQLGTLILSMPALGAAATTAFGAMKAAALSTIPFLASVSAALMPIFAVLTAGVAAGIAGYEALRAMNINGFGDKHASSKEIFADLRKTMMGDPIADAKAATEAATKALPAMAATPAVATPAAPIVQSAAPMIAASGVGGGDVAALQAQLDAAALKDDDSGLKALRLRLRNAKAAERGALKDAKQDASEAKRLEEEQRDVEIAQLEARYDILINRLENQKKIGGDNTALELQIAEMKRNRELEIANERSGGDTSSADFRKAALRSSADFAIARDNAAAGKFNDISKSGGTQSSVNPIFQSLAFLRGGGSFSNLAQLDKAGMTGDSGTGTTGGTSRSIDVPLSARGERTATNQLLLKFFGEYLIEDGVNLQFSGQVR